MKSILILLLIFLSNSAYCQDYNLILTDYVWCFQEHVTGKTKFNANIRKWEFKQKYHYYMFSDLWPFAKVVDWRYYRDMEIIDETNHWVLFIDKKDGVLRKVYFLFSSNYIGPIDWEVKNAKIFSKINRRKLKRLEGE